MGIWNSNLYANDTTADIRDTYIECLRNNMSNEDAYSKTYDEYCELIGTDEEELFWLAMADTQWEFGRLMPAVKLNAQRFINQPYHSFYDEFDAKKRARWNEMLRALLIRLDSQQPPEKYVPLIQKFERNPWEVGDIYAYRFHSKRSKGFGLFGKYVAIQKIGDALSYENMTFSVIQIYDKAFSSLPTVSDILGIRVLPLVYPPDIEGTPKHICDYLPSFDWYTKAIMLLEKPSHYPAKHLTFIGNSPLQHKEYKGNECQDCFWETTGMEDWIVDYYIKWQGQEY